MTCKAGKVQRFDSMAEARRFDELRILQRAGKIGNLECQRRYPISINGHKIGDYVADFVYDERSTNAVIIEDVKGGTATDTALSRFKRKCVAAIYCQHVHVVRR